MFLEYKEIVTNEARLLAKQAKMDAPDTTTALDAVIYDERGNKVAIVEIITPIWSGDEIYDDERCWTEYYIEDGVNAIKMGGIIILNDYYRVPVMYKKVVKAAKTSGMVLNMAKQIVDNDWDDYANQMKEFDAMIAKDIAESEDIAKKEFRVVFVEE